ncbi:MAG: hypothetical protein KKA84_12765 [Bacteroidetes bacterium]|nr:hypothetical protein [Bacteroidota bacterium]
MKVDKTVDLEEIIKSEIAFAKLSETTGRKTAFLSNLLDSATVLVPMPAKSIDVYSTVEDLPGQLLWHPEYAEISDDGNIGFTTGPWIFTVNSDEPKKYYGHYLSIWQRIPERGWKIIFDAGIGYQSEVDLNIETKKFPEIMAPETESTRELSQAISSFNDMVLLEGEKGAYNSYLNEYCRVYREGIAPEISRQVQLNQLIDSPFEYKYTNYTSGVSESEDFGYEFGSLEVNDIHSSLITNYSFCRIWKLVGSEWKILIDLRLRI